MPATSEKQRRLFAAAAHGATFAKAKELRDTVPMKTLRDFAGAVKKKKNNLGHYQHPKRR